MSAIVKKMPLGAEPGKVILLTGLLGLAGYLFYTNFWADGSSPAPASAPAAKASTAKSIRQVITETPAASPSETAPAFARGRTPRQGDFKPTLRPRKPEDRLDATTVDPTLRIDLITRLQNVKIERVERSLFDFSGAGPAAPKQPEPKITLKPVAAPKKPFGPEPPPPPPPPTPPTPKPVAPPIPLKFFGYQIVKAGGGPRRTFCLDGEEILVPAEGDTIKGRYKIIRIGLTSVVVEDTQFKSQQTLPIEEASQGG